MTSLRGFVFACGAAVVAFAGAGCSDDDDDGPDPGPAETVELTLSGFPAAAEGDGDFELWIAFALGSPGPRGPESIVADGLRGSDELRHSAAASAGRFRIGAGGQIVGTDGGEVTFEIDPADETVPHEDDGTVAWQLALDAFVTFEPRDDVSADDPNLPAIVGGNFLNGEAALGVGHADAVGNDFTSAAGSVHLATPTTASGADEMSGLWFAQPGGAAASLTLPALSGGWRYEGWVNVAPHGDVTLGRFTVPTTADEDGAGPGAGPLPGYHFPGSDFPVVSGGGSVDLRPSEVFVTLEPPLNADGSARPSFLRILAADLGAAEPVGAAVPLTNVASMPSGHVTIPFHP